MDCFGKPKMEVLSAFPHFLEYALIQVLTPWLSSGPP